MTCGTGLRAALAELADLVLARSCGGCRRTGSRWCGACAAQLEVPPACSVVGDGLTVWSATGYEGPVREAINGWKDHGRVDLTPVLADPLVAVAAAALGAVDGRQVRLVPVPSSARSRRRRGREPVRELALGLGARTGLQVLPALRHARLVADQPGLGVARRQANLQHALAVAPGWAARLRGRPVLLVDDVLTSGATLREGRRAVEAAGAQVLAAVTVAVTPRRPARPSG